VRQDQDKRYARQIMVPEVGPEGQALLSTKKVLIVGAGGLGTPCSAYLAGAGIGHIGILDNDVVSLSNLPRQILYTTNDIGREKAKVLAEKLAAANHGLSLVPMIQSLTKENVSNTIEGFDVVISCVDNLETRYILNQACISSGIPMIEGAISGFTGMVTTIIPGQGPCYQCIFPKKLVPVQKAIGVLGPTPGVTGSIQAAEALKLLLGKGLLLSGRLLLLDLLSGDFRTITVRNNPYCPICGKNAKILCTH
jgi:molybdopterin/thiamine biosynthesis adenylyltransferase